MAFASGIQTEIGTVGSGEIIGNVGVVSSYNSFEEGLKAGLFSKYNDGVVELIDGEADPIIAGVVKREVSSALEDAGTFKTDNTIMVDVVENGLVTVEIVSGLTINKFEPVYVYNNTDTATEDWGKATNHSTDKDSGDNDVANAVVDGYFYKEINPTTWVIRLK